MLDLLTISFITRFARRPMHLIGLGGLVALTFGVGIIGSLILAHVMYVFEIVADKSWNLHDRPVLTLGVLLMVVGVQLFSIGLLGELLVKRVGAETPDRSYSVRRIVEDPTDE
jgi:hypothetical protein